MRDEPISGATYFQKLMQNKVQSAFNRRINMMAGGGMPRSSILMRWIKKPRLIMLMESLRDQLQSGNPNWLGSFNQIEKLVRSTAKQMGMSLAKNELGKPGSISKGVPIQKACSDEDLVDAYCDMIENPTDATYRKTLEALGGFVISEFEKAGGKIDFSKFTNKYEADIKSANQDTPLGKHWAKLKGAQTPRVALNAVKAILSHPHEEVGSDHITEANRHLGQYLSQRGAHTNLSANLNPTGDRARQLFHNVTNPDYDSHPLTVHALAMFAPHYKNASDSLKLKAQEVFGENVHHLHSDVKKVLNTLASKGYNTSYRP